MTVTKRVVVGPKRGRLYDAFFLVHEIIGLVSGLIIVIVCFTGAVLVFEDELTSLMHPARTAHVAGAGTPMGIDSLLAAVATHDRPAKLATITLYEKPTRPAMLASEDGERRWVDRFTGAVVARQSGKEAFFEQMTLLHRRLLAGETGRRVVGVATVCFMFLLLTGIWIWWPKSVAALRARITLARRVGWKRRNYDWHVVLGIYSVVLLLVFGATGLVWSYKTLGRAVDNLTPKPERTPAVPRIKPSPNVRPAPLGTVLAAATASLHAGSIIAIYLPEGPRDAVMVLGLPYDAAWPQAFDYAYVDPYTARVLRVDWFRNRPLSEYARRITRPLHVGTLYGLPSQIAALLACLVATISPITGFIMWVNRKWPRTFRRRSTRPRAVPRTAEA